MWSRCIVRFGRQKLSVIFNFDKQGIIDFTKKIQKPFIKLEKGLFQKSSMKSLVQQLEFFCKMREKHIKKLKNCFS